jgi:hypothetical protein
MPPTVETVSFLNGAISTLHTNFEPAKKMFEMCKVLHTNFESAEKMFEI